MARGRFGRCAVARSTSEKRECADRGVDEKFFCTPCKFCYGAEEIAAMMVPEPVPEHSRTEFVDVPEDPDAPNPFL